MIRLRQHWPESFPDEVKPELLTSIVMDDKGKDLLIQVFKRGLNCWDEAPAALKELGDMLEFGYITQNYRVQG